ncbi:MAG: trypsin-like serine protease, partial [Chitinophagaceae bacterium]
LLKMDREAAIPTLKMESLDESSPVGAWVVVLGNPFGTGITATIGILSAKPGAIAEPAYLKRRMQLNAAINPGNSGGPVLNLRGEVIGVASAAVPGGFGLGFAVPASTVKAFLNKNRMD